MVRFSAKETPVLSSGHFMYFRQSIMISFSSFYHEHFTLELLALSRGSLSVKLRPECVLAARYISCSVTEAVCEGMSTWRVVGWRGLCTYQYFSILAHQYLAAQSL